jgi:hypothetical protein
MLRQVPATARRGQKPVPLGLATSGLRCPNFADAMAARLRPAQSERWQGRHCCYVCCAGNVPKLPTLTTRALAEQTWWTSTQTLKRKAEHAQASMTY